MPTQILGHSPFVRRSQTGALGVELTGRLAGHDWLWTLGWPVEQLHERGWVRTMSHVGLCVVPEPGEDQTA
jgi:hypothetical protein